jgi:hypothetical protein
MSRLWWVCAMLLCIGTPLLAQQSDPLNRQEVNPLSQDEALVLLRQESGSLTRQESGSLTRRESGSLTRQEASPLTRYEAGLDLLAHAPSHADASLLSEEANATRKSVALAALYSLLLPGMGELYAEGFSTGKYLLIAEGVLWLGYAAVEIHGNDLRDGARSYAAAHAGADATGKDDDFYVNIGNFMSLEEYNDKQLRDREPEKLYDPLEGYNWLWDSDASRLAFRDQRIGSENMYNNQKFIGAAIIVNHIISAINAARSAIAYNNAQNDALGALRLSSRLLGGPGQPHGVMVTIARQF